MHCFFPDSYQITYDHFENYTGNPRLTLQISLSVILSLSLLQQLEYSLPLNPPSWEFIHPQYEVSSVQSPVGSMQLECYLHNCLSSICHRDNVFNPMLLPTPIYLHRCLLVSWLDYISRLVRLVLQLQWVSTKGNKASMLAEPSNTNTGCIPLIISNFLQQT